MPDFPINATSAGSSGGGFFSSLSSNPMLPMVGVGIGAAASTLFGSSGSAPQMAIPLLREGRALEKNIFNAINSGGIPYNLASRYIGQAKKLAMERKRMYDKQLAGVGSREVVPGSSLTMLSAKLKQQLMDSMEGQRSLGEAKIGQAQNRLSQLINFRNQKLQVPIMAAQNQAAQAQYQQLISARKGAALGSLAELAGASYFYA